MSDPSIPRWQEIPHDGTADSLARSRELDPKSISVSENEVLILPENLRLGEPIPDATLFPRCSKEVACSFRENGILPRYYDDGRRQREIILHHADIIVPALVFLGSQTAALGINILANWIYDRWIKGGRNLNTTLEVEYVELESPAVVRRWRRIKGNAADVCRLLKEESKTLGRETFDERPARFSPPRTEPAESPEAREAVEAAEKMMVEAEQCLQQHNAEEAERLLRESLGELRTAYLLQPDNKTYSRYLHQVGRDILDLFGCMLKLENGQYWVTCPVMLSHAKVGFSMGGSGTTICSICGSDTFSCEHVTGRSYDNVVAFRHHNCCNICGKEQCDHIEGQVYHGVQALGFITDLTLDHVALVDNPSDPRCCLRGYSLSENDLLELRPEEKRDRFVYGQTTVLCHHCKECAGDE